MSTDYTYGKRVQHHSWDSAVTARFDRFGIGRPINWNRRNTRTASRPKWSAGDLAWKIIAADSVPGHARGLLKAWTGWERLSETLWPTLDVSQAPHGLVRIRVESYRQALVTLPGGVTVVRGDPVGELHCNNRALLRLIRSGRNPFAACRDDLRGLAAWAQTDPIGRQVVALHACTILAKGASRFGFITMDTPITIRRRMERIFFTGLLLLYSSEGLARLRHGTTARAYPRDIWITRHDLLRLYAPSGFHGDSRIAGAAGTNAFDRTTRDRRENLFAG